MSNYYSMAQDIENAKKRMDDYFLKRDLDAQHYKAWLDSCNEFQIILSRRHSNPLLYPDLIKLKEGDAAAIQTAINYLCANPLYFSSGYKKEFLTKRLKQLVFTKRALFSPQQIEQLNLIVLNKVRSGFSREFRYYCRLAQALSSPALIKQLSELSYSQDLKTRLQAAWMLAYLNTGPGEKS